MFGYAPFYHINKGLLWNLVRISIYFLTGGEPDFIRRIQAPTIMKFLDPRLKEVCLDLACGKGALAYEIYKKESNVLALDLTIPDDLINTIYQNTIQTLRFIQGNGYYLPLKSESIDKILMSSFLQMVEHDQIVLNECLRVLKINGILVLSVPERYLFIPVFFSDRKIAKIVSKLLRLPRNYNDFLLGLNNFFSVRGKGYYTKKELIHLLSNHGFIIDKIKQSPGMAGSFFYEMHLILNYSIGRKINFLSSLVFLFYPIVLLLDKYIIPPRIGCEIVIKMKKMQI